MPIFIRLIDYKSSDTKEKGFFDPKNKYEAKQEDFEKIPGSPIAYWVSAGIKNIFEHSDNYGDKYEVKLGISPGNTEKFLKLWNEVDINNIGFNYEDEADKNLKWFPCNKGGSYRKWFGNNEYVINWENNGNEIINYKDDKGKLLSRPQNLKYQFKEPLADYQKHPQFKLNINFKKS